MEARRQQLLEAAVRLISKQSFDATSVAAIAKEAGVSKGSVYLYFPSKQALLDELVKRYSLVGDIESLVAGIEGVPLETLVRSAVPVLWRQLCERQEIAAILLREGAVQPANARVFLERVMLPSNRLLAAALERGLGPQRAAELDCFVAARALMGMLLVFFITQKVFGADELAPLSDDQITNTVCELFLNGALGERGTG